MSTNIEQLDIVELQDLAQKTQQLIEAKRREKIDEAYQQLKEVAKSVGLTLDELLEHGRGKNRKTTKSTGEKRVVAPRYRNPADATQTWTGRGKQPRWVVDALAAGKKIEDLAI